MKTYKSFIGATIACLLLFAGQPNAEVTNPVTPQQTTPYQEQSPLQTLNTLLSYLVDLENQIETIKIDIRQAGSNEEKLKRQQNLQKLQADYRIVQNNFTKISTGIDLDAFESKPYEKFDWQDELLSLLKPAIEEINNLTVKPRKIATLKKKLGYYQERLPLTQKAIENLTTLKQDTTSPSLQARIVKMVNEWENRQQRLQTTLSITRLQLEELIGEKIPFLNSLGNAMKTFFKERGQNLLFAASTCILVFLIFRFVYRMTPLFKSTERTLIIRSCDLLFHIATVLATLTALFLVLYVSEDWLLLSLAIIFLIGIGWAAKEGLPRYWQQAKLLLNIGAVRENERIIYNQIPWLVKSINLYTTLSNPVFPKCEIRLPIDSLLDMTSRPCQKHEPWFPCHVDDWVILADGVRGKVVSQNHEFVQLILRGGAYKTYETSNFLGNSPMNLSRNFRLKVSFGIDYKHQPQCTTTILEQLSDYIRDCLEREGYNEDVLNLRIEFAVAAASSLDLVIIADFNGRMAEHYKRLERAIQRWAVDACNHHGWEIPFTQVTVHSVL